VTTTKYPTNVDANILEPLFFKYGVDVVFGGHIHMAMMTCPLHNATCLPRDQGGIIYVMMANGGITVNGGVAPPPLSWIPEFWKWWNFVDCESVFDID
jgi:hypothetical protein